MHNVVYAITVNWNLREETLACVASLFAAGLPTGRALVVDNGSNDGSVEAIRNEFGHAVQVIASACNLGFAGGNNLGITRALERGATWVFLINNDTRVAPSLFSAFEETVRRSREYAVLAPLILQYDAPDRVWSLGDRLVPGTLITRSLLRGRRVPETLPALVPVDFVTACGVFIHRDVFTRIGLLDTSFFMYAEDVDFCWRARQADFKIACVTRARMWHKGAYSTGPSHPQARYWRIRNQIRFYRQAARRWQIPTMFTFTLLRSLRFALSDLTRGRTSLLQTTARAWVDGWFRVEPEG